MGFSKETFEQYRREIRIMWRVLAVGAVLAGGAHIASLPWISRMVSGLQEGASSEIEAIPIEIFVEEEVVQQAPDPEPDTPEENPEPAASAQRPSAAPLATNTEPIPTNEVAAADTVAVSPSIATENGEVDGQGAVGTSEAIGLVPGTGEPTESGDRINLPDIAVGLDPEPREAVQNVALRPPSSRVVSCNPCTLPEYPSSARRDEIEGQPTISVTFDENGRVIEAVVEVSSGNAAFDRAAVEEAKRNWRFQDNQGLGGQLSVDVTYVIDDSEQYEEARQAGEVRAVNLPVGQQIRSVAPDQPASEPASAPSSETGPTGSTENSTAGPNEAAEPGTAETSLPESPSPASADAREAEASPTESVPTGTSPTTSLDGDPPSNSQSAPESTPPTPASNPPEPIAPELVIPEPVVAPPPPSAPPTPLVAPPSPAAAPTTPPDILPASDF